MTSPSIHGRSHKGALARIAELEHLFRIDGEQHAKAMKAVRHEQDARIKAYGKRVAELEHERDEARAALEGVWRSGGATYVDKLIARLISERDALQARLSQLESALAQMQTKAGVDCSDMTDTSAHERARQVYGVIEAFGWDILWKHDKPVPDDAWPIDIIAAALTEAKRQGAEDAQMEIRRLRDCILSARWRLTKGRALWNGPCHECDAALETALTGKPPPYDRALSPDGGDG